MGLIHLYSATSTSFDNNGTPLVTAREAVVKRDEGFQLTFSIPISQNELHKRVQKEMIVSAMTPDGVNYFRIWDIEKRTTDVKVTALQLLYSLDVKQINPFGVKQHTGNSVLQTFANSFKSSISPYTFSSSILTLKDFDTNEKDDTSTSHNALAILNKITDNWSGELMLNGFDVRMISKLGTKTDALLYEHKNIASFSDSSSMNGIVTRIYATATYTPERAEGATEDPEPVVLTATVDSPLINQYAVIYEATAEYNDARTVDELRTEILKQYSEFNVDKPERTIDVDTNIVDGTAINFGDELVLKYLVHDVDEVIRCVGYEYDPISENYIGVTLGTLEKTFLTKVTEGISSSVTRQFAQISRDIQGIQMAANGKNRIAYGPSPVPNAIEGDLWFYHPEGRPDEVEIRVYQNGLWTPAPFLTEQDKLAIEQEMTDLYNDAIAAADAQDKLIKEQIATEVGTIGDAMAQDKQDAITATNQALADAKAHAIAQDKLITTAVNTEIANANAEIVAAKQAAQKAYTDAVADTDAKIAAKDLEYEAIFDDYDEQVATIGDDVTQANTKADQALEEAGISNDLAQTAKDLADTAKTNAQTALDNASKAQTDVSAAVSDASQAKADAQTAITEAGQAVVSANTAKSNAQTALTDAQTAISTANNADTKSGLAETAANTAKTNAQTALDNSNTAITNAADAITKAGQAETAANTAKTNAQTALDDAQSALTTAGSADSKAGQAIAKANAIPTTITDIIADKNLVNGTYVDTKVNAATGAWSQELVRVEGKLDGLDIGGRNYFVDRLMLDVDNYERIGSYYYYTINNLSPEEVYTVSVRENYTNDISIGSGPNRALRINNDKTDSLGMDIIDVRLSNGIRTYEREIRANEDGQLFIISYIPSLLDEIHNMIKIEKGNIATDWTPAPEDLYSQEEFKIFNAQYTQDVTGITGRLTTVETDKLDGSTFQTFKQAEYQVTADKVASTITRVDTAEGKITTQGTAISQQATAIASKADKTVVDTLAGTVSTQGTSISQNATDISSKADSELVDDIKGTVDTHTTEISQNATDIASKASSTSVNALTGRVSTAETTISQHATAITSKASQTEVDTVKGTVSSHTTTLGQHATAISSKAESSLVDTIKDTVDTHTTDISQNATDIASKASYTSVNALTGRVSTAESNISQNATAITQRVTTATYNTGIASKENTVLKQSTAPAHVNGRLWLDTSVTPNILKRSTGSAWVKATPTTPGEVGAYSQSAGAGLAGRLTTAETTITQTATAIESKADQTEVDTVKGTVSGHTTTLSQHATAIASKAESNLVNTIKGTVDTHTTEISQNATAIASKASSSSVSTLTGRVSTAETTISQHATAITSKASQTEVDTVKGTVSGHTSTLSQHASQISARLTTSQVNSLVDGKGLATSTYVDNQITASASGIRADMSVVEGKIPTDYQNENLLSESTNLSKWRRRSVNTKLEKEPFSTSDKDVYRLSRVNASDTVAIGIESDSTFNITGGQIYTLSYDFLTYNGGYPGYIYILDDATGANVKLEETIKNEGIIDRWVSPNNQMTRRSITFLGHRDIKNARLLFGLSDVNTGITGFYFSRIKIEKGGKATPYVLSLADLILEEDFTVFKGEYEATAEALTSRLTAIDKVGGRLSTAESNISQNATAISARLTTAQVNSLVDGKGLATATYVDNKITATADSLGAELTKVEGKIPTSFGGTNLIPNSDLINHRRGTGIWRSITILKNSTEGLEVSSNGPAGETYGIMSDLFNVVAGQEYVLSADLGSYYSVPLLDYVFVLNQHGSGIQRLDSITIKASDIVLRRYSLKFTATVSDKVRILFGRTTQATGEGFRIRNIQVEKGSIESDWSPSVADLVGKEGFDVFQTNFNTKAEGWDATSTYIGNNKVKLNTLVSNADGWSNTISYVDGNKTAFNETIAQVNSYKQTLGTDGGKIAQMVMTDSSFSTKILDTVDVGGANILPNTDFSIAGNIDKVTPRAPAGTTVYRDKPADYPLHFAYAGATSQQPGYVVGFEIGKAAGEGFSMIQGQWYTLSFLAVLSSSVYNPLDYAYVMTNSAGNRLLYNYLVSRKQVGTAYSGIPVNKYTYTFQATSTDLDAWLLIGSKVSYVDPYQWIRISQIQVEKGNVATDWTNADVDKANQSQVTQLAGSWALTLKSGNDIKTQINASTDSIRLQSKFIHLSGTSLIDTAVIKSAHIDTLNANKIVGNTADFNTIRTGVLTTNAVKSTHIDANTAFFDKVFSTSSATDRLVAQGAWITSANITSLDAGVIKAGTIETARLLTSEIVTQGLTTDVIKSTHIQTSSLLVDKIFANQAMVDRLWSKTIWANKVLTMTLDAGQITAGKISASRLNASEIVTSGLTADVVKATHILADTALIDTIFANQVLVDRLWSKTIWGNKITAITLDASQITAGTIGASRISISSLANLDLGGRNLLRWTDFEKSHDRDRVSAWSTTSVFSDKSSDHPNRWVVASHTNQPVGTRVGMQISINAQDRIYLRKGRTYTLSFLTLDSGTVHNGHYNYMHIMQGNQANQSISHTFVNRKQVGTAFNTMPVYKHVYTFNAPFDSADSWILIGTTISAVSQYQWIRVAEVMLEEGNKASAWSPSPLDQTNRGELSRTGTVEIHGGNIKADTLDVGAITGNKATFISTGFKSLNSQATINGHAIRIQNSAGEFVEMNNTPELRSDDAGGTAVVLGKGRVHFYDSRGHSKGYVGTDMHTAGSYDFGTFLSKGSGIYKFARMADATQTTYAYYTVKAGLTAPASVITNMVQNGYLPDGNPQQFVAKGNMLSQLNGWPAYPNWPKLSAGQQIRYKEVTSQTTGDAYEDIWKFGPSSQGDWRIYFAKHATFEGGTTGTSDRRLKHDIETTQVEALHHIESLAFKEFRWNRDNKYEPLGLIAQDSGIVRVADDDMEGIDIQRAIMLGLKGIQELQAVVKEQAAKIKQLEEINNQ